MALEFAGHVEIVPVSGHGLIAVDEHGYEIYSGAQFATLAELIDGKRPEAELLGAFAADEQQAVTAALEELKRGGVLVARSSDGRAVPDAAWWTSQRVAPEVAAARIAEATVEIRALGELDAGPTAAALSHAQIRLEADAELTVVLTKDYLDDRLAEINADALRADQRWLLAKPVGSEVLVGPLFTPGHGPCWECLAQRLREHRALERHARELAGRSADSSRETAPRSLQGLGPALVATELARSLVGARNGLESLILSFDARAWQGAEHQLVWRPQCPACGDAEASLDRGATPIRLRRRSAQRRPGEPLRGIAANITLERFEHHVSPVTGAVPTLARMPGPEFMHVYVAGQPWPRIHGSRDGWETITGLRASGKGTSDPQARASALCEALERYSGGFGGEEPRHRGTIEELGPSAIEPNEYMRFSDRQYAERERWNAEAVSYRTFVPERFDPSEAIDWSPVWSLTHERERWLPTALCYYRTDLAGQRFCRAESNGNAAGNTIEEAILHGLLELVERDHVALWWYNRLRAPRVELESIEDPWLRRFRGYLTDLGRPFWVLDLTADLGIPVAAALAPSADGARVAIGFGAHLDLAGAAVRAATELAQLGFGGGSGGLGGGGEPHLRLDEHPFVRVDGDGPEVVCSAEDRFTGDLAQALERCCVAIEGQRLEILVLDQSRPDIGLPVVKVLAPGLRHFWPRFGPGRLYEVPVELGRLARPHTEHELNQTSPTI